ncbi:MAG: protein-tyrosine-phosphatase [Marinoscillum sp.]|uniref:protein-tyrosine-phosphatase n=1 Tax=Marinoscillum sp. TaxID=2024838 RepID=UPI0032F4A683
MKTRMFSLLMIALLLCNTNTMNAQTLNKKLKKYTSTVVTAYDQVNDERKARLEEIGDFLVNKIEEDGRANVIVICTHNSRRSHIAQAWLQTAAVYYGIKGIQVFSGGLEGTAFHPNAVAALERAGFKASSVQSGANPVYSLSNGSGAYLMYSKKYTDRQNPQEGFGALMVCADADKSCPIVQGAEARFSLPFEDPRYYDNTPSQDLKYDETVRLIAHEMFYLAYYVKTQTNLKLEAGK